MKNIYKRHRFPPFIIQHAVWLYLRFNLSVRDVEDLLAERNISVSYEAIRLWINKFGPGFTKRLRRRHSSFGDTYFLDEVFVRIGGKQHYLWRRRSGWRSRRRLFTKATRRQCSETILATFS